MSEFTPPKVYILNHIGVKERMTHGDKQFTILKASTRICDLPNGLIITKEYGKYFNIYLKNPTSTNPRYQRFSITTDGSLWHPYTGGGVGTITTDYLLWMVSFISYRAKDIQRLLFGS